MHYAARLCIYTWYISAFLDSIYFNILLSYCLHLCLFLNFVKLLSSHDASKGARAPKAWKSAVLNEIENKVGENGKTHRSSGYLEIPGDTLQKPMNKQNMIEHVESGLSLWSFQKSTWRYWKDNSMAPVHLQQNGTLGLEHRHSTGTTSRCEEHGLPNSKTKARQQKARQIPDQNSDDFVLPRSIVPILVFPTLLWDQIWGHGDMSWWYWNTPKTSLPCHHRRHQGVGFAQWSCLDEETSFLKKYPPNSLQSWKAEFNFNQQFLQQKNSNQIPKLLRLTDRVPKWRGKHGQTVAMFRRTSA